MGSVTKPDLVDSERVVLLGFLGGYSYLPRNAYALELRQFVALWGRRDVRLGEVRSNDRGG
jgi:hypothetical protein